MGRRPRRETPDGVVHVTARGNRRQDVFTDAKVPRRERASWPLVVRGDEVVAIPGIVENPDVRVVQS